MEFLRLAKRRTLLSEIVYVLLNVGLAAALLLVVWVVESPVPAFALVLLSKWRVFAVRPRYWIAHVQANTVDLIVSLSLVVLLYVVGSTAQGGEGMAVQIVLTLCYAAWLLLLKPRTKRSYVTAQAAVALGLGTIALYSIGYDWPSSVIVVGMFLLGYFAAHHVLSAYSDNKTTLLSLVWGFVVAQLGWISYHWLIAYDVPSVTSLKIPQITIIVLALGFLAERIYSSYSKHSYVRVGDIILPALSSLGLIAIILLFFNSIGSATI
ncbi:MAG: hypothetical protein WAS27_03600 [Candidatus Saccharimonadales bacterium]